MGLLLFSGNGMNLRDRAETAGWWLVGHVVGLLAASAALLPFLEAYGHSTSRAAHEFRPDRSSPLHRVLFFVMPTVYGTASRTRRARIAGFSEVAGYFRLVALLLAGAAAGATATEREVAGCRSHGALGVLILFGVPRWI